MTRLDDNKATRLIIERVFSLGEMHEINRVIRFYGKKRVIAVLCNLTYLDLKTLNFISKLFDEPVEDFKCHQKKQSRQRFWNL